MSDETRPEAPPVPPVVYLPVTLDDDGEVADARLIQLGDGRVALLAYTALDRLIDCCGEHQPWMLVASGGIDQAPDRRWDVRFLDVELPEALRLPAPAAS